MGLQRRVCKSTFMVELKLGCCSSSSTYVRMYLVSCAAKCLGFVTTIQRSLISTGGSSRTWCGRYTCATTAHTAQGLLFPLYV